MVENSGKVVLVTGGNRGLGLDIVRAFAQEGATVLVAGRSASACEEAAAAVRKEGGSAHCLQLDVTDFASVEKAISDVERTYGRLDILINNAALVSPLSRLQTADAAQWRRSVETNIIGSFNVARAALRLLLVGKGIVVNISAGAADAPFDGMSAYCCSKAGLLMLTRSLASEYESAGLRAFGFRPGTIDTDMQTEIRSSRVNKISLIPRENLRPPEVPAKALVRLCGKQRVPSGIDVVWNDPLVES